VLDFKKLAPQWKNNKNNKQEKCNTPYWRCVALPVLVHCT